MVRAIDVSGNKRIETDTILSYLTIRPGDPFDPTRLDESLKTLYATGLFSNVVLDRRGDTLLVKVAEYPLVNQVVFEGNHALADTDLRKVVQLRPRAVFTSAAAEEDRHRILDSYALKGHYDATVTPEIIRLPENRVNVVYEIHDGPSTLISRISFVGNREYSESRLAGVINSRQERWWAFLSSADQYSPQRLQLDQELLRRFYYKHGFADFRIVSATAELSPDRKKFFLTFTVHEGARYRVSKIAVHSSLKGMTPAILSDHLEISQGDWFDADAMQRSADKMEEYVRSHGYAFVQVTPRVTKDPKAHTLAIDFDVSRGPRVYVERIDIIGNTRTRDSVIRRQFHIAEGDAVNAGSVRRTEQRLKDLDYFQNVSITVSPGSAPDKAVLTTRVTEKATGQISLGGGFSTDVGLLLDAGIRQSNIIGSGVDAGVNGILAQKQSSIDFNITDPYFENRNLLLGADVFLLQYSNLGTAPYDERRVGFSTRLGYNFTTHLQQVWTYALIGRTVYNIQSGSSAFIYDEQGYTLLSQVGQTIALDYRNSTILPTRGYVLSLATDFAGLGGSTHFLRTKIDGAYYIPLDRLMGEDGWTIRLRAGAGYLFNLGHQEQIIDRFFLGGDNLRGFQTGGVGPHDAVTGDSLGGRFIWTGSTQLNFPLPVSPDLGLSGHVFADVGALTQGSFESGSCVNQPGGVCPAITSSAAPRVGVGFGISWRSSFGLINIDFTPFVIKQPGDQTQVFRFGFGTRF
ncbi:MAG: outer membrane protein assembly factor BamA [Rhodospirillales bacterium]|nr:outer membrane protein assembly factor BamA [Rhodospirillales bacterium]